MPALTEPPAEERVDASAAPAEDPDGVETTASGEFEKTGCCSTGAASTAAPASVLSPAPVAEAEAADESVDELLDGRSKLSSERSSVVEFDCWVISDGDGVSDATGVGVGVGVADGVGDGVGAAVGAGVELWAT